MRRLLLLALLAASLAAASPAAALVIKLGTVAPEGSVWHDGLLQIRQRWQTITGGAVELRIYAGGVLGGEAEMVRKLQRGGLDAVAITAAGLPRIDRSVEVLTVPLLFHSLDEFARVRAAVAPELERRLEARHFKVLGWADAGWVFLFTKEPVRTPDDLRRLRLWISANAPQGERLYKEFGFQVVPLPVTEVVTGLQTGLIDAINVPPLFALLDRSYQATGYMTDLSWAPLNAGIVVSTAAWAAVPERFRAPMLAAVREVTQSVQTAIREAGAQAIAEMRRRGLVVVEVDEAARQAWMREARAAYPRLRELSGAPELFDEVLRLAGEH